MSRDLVVFKTCNEEVLASFHEAVVQHRAWADAIQTFAKEVHPDAKPMVRRENFGGGDRFDGVSVVDPAPEGWRVKNQRTGAPIMVPRLSTKAGKAWNKRLAEVSRAPDVRASLPGMPDGALTGFSWIAPAIEESDGYLWVKWSHDPMDADLGWSSKHKSVDFSIWERVKLSEFYAMTERQEVTA